MNRKHFIVSSLETGDLEVAVEAAGVGDLGVECLGAVPLPGPGPGSLGGRRTVHGWNYICYYYYHRASMNGNPTQ